MAKGTFQVEGGLRKDQQNGSNYSTRQPAIQWRYGLLNRLKFRISTTSETQRFVSKNKMNQGLLPVEPGLKASVLQTKDSSFTLSVFGQVAVPQLASKDYQSINRFYRARLLLQNEFTDNFGIQYNIGRDWVSDEQQQVWVYAFAPHIDISDKWQVFAEGYGYLQRSEEPQHYLSAGLAYFLSNNLELDVNGGKGLNSKAATYFITAGVSFRLK
ncbi:MAG TPA: transporter [Flavisolibacter sp.]|nr:transporter [Flavisolibacter sp.]